ncbi:sugar transport protein 13, partial [Tanacetum coccineum]
MDVLKSGLHFTWNKSPGNPCGLLKKLDRVMSNVHFLDKFPSANDLFLPFVTSDHSPSVLCIPGVSGARPKPFKFVNFLASKPEFLPIIKSLKKPLRKLKYSQRVLSANVKRCKEELCSIQSNVAKDPTNVAIRKEEVSCMKKFNDAVDIMIRPISNEEIKAALFSMDDDKASGPDGFSSKFFKASWSIVGSEVSQAIKDYFSNGKLLKEINSTIIALVPKIKTPKKVSDFRPISCCNVLYKCISKVIANRVKGVLNSLVSSCQSAFIPSRQISDNILLTQELMRNYHRKGGPPKVAFKIDINKAYDFVDWGFLRQCLLFFGFP